jgi:hypothetical protein
MGNATLHGWVDSAIYTELLDENRDAWTKTRMESEFRSMPPRKAIELGIHFEPPGSLLMDLEISSYSLDRVLLRMAQEEPGITVIEIGKRLSLDKRTVLARVRGSETVEVKGGKKGRGKTWQVYALNGAASSSPSGAPSEETPEGGEGD